ncbi:conserved exported hypothetical protein [metagenome]|uniref:Uncharacterized protein n=1 Tax=metagenome TaxID=256318 RepID=A0A2P2BZE5_9ZZZZ
MVGGRRRVRTPIVVLLLVSLLAACRGDAQPPTSQAAVGCRQEHRCVWVRFPFRDFVPQGMALGPHDTAYLTGYQWKPRRGHRYCQVVEVDRTSGEVRAQSVLRACRHGGGAVLTGQGLWITGPSRLWLLDPAAIGDTDPLLREWSVEQPIVASTLTANRDGLIMATFSTDEPGRTYRFAFDDLLAGGATMMVAQGQGRGRVVATSVRRSPARVQGVTHHHGELYFASSSSYCGALTLPSGRRVALVPGAEGLGFDAAGDLWVVSESSAGPYRRAGDRPRTPTLTRLDPAELRSEPACAWD